MRKRIFNEWKRYAWQDVKTKYGFSKKWFYKWLGRFLERGEDGLRNKEIERSLPHPEFLGWEKEAAILCHVYDNPCYGPDRIARKIGFKVSGKTIWKLLIEQNLNTWRKRRLWARHMGDNIISEPLNCLVK